MSAKLTRPAPMYMQLAKTLAADIQAGAWQPGDTLPSEAEMVRDYGVGKHTVRQAMAELRALGLTTVQQGKGSIVRGAVSPKYTLKRTVHRRGRRYEAALVQEGQESEEPAVTRIHIDARVAALLGQQDQDGLSVDRLITNTTTGSRIAHRVIIPMATASEVPVLAQTPTAPVAELYGYLSDAGHTLTWDEHVSARIAFPDERATLRMRDAGPLLTTFRVTYGTDRRPLMVEELRVPATTAELVFPVTATKPDSRRPMA